jgi:hypothetical protein
MVSSNDTISIALRDVTRLDVSRGRTRNSGRGFGIGLLAGLSFGVLGGLASGDEEAPCLFCMSAEEQMVLGGVVFGGLGGLVGAVIGTLSYSERWVAIPADHLRVEVRPTSVGVRISLRR